MKISLLIIVLNLVAFVFTYSQIDVKEKVKDESVERADNKTDEMIDKGFDAIENGVEGLFKKKEKKQSQEKENNKNEKADVEDNDAVKQEPDKPANDNEKKISQPSPSLQWAKYDFIPGNVILFEDIQEGEENGEFPSRWDLAYNGAAENAMFGSDNVIYFREASTCIVPFIKNPESDYLPDIFTLELDAWFEPEEYCAYLITFYDQKNQSESTIELSPLVIEANNATLHGRGNGYYPGKEDNEITQGFWRHIAISFNTRAMKIYLDDARVVNIPNLGANPEGISLCCDGMNSAGSEGINRFIQNIRLAKGGVKLYDKLLQNGKIVTNGIRFDVDKATIRPESMGVINSIVQLMKEHPELNFSVEGHTDSDGDDASNQDLSERRANAVTDQLIKSGIDALRLKSKGWGESKPVDINDTPEGKANNRRVEFVKI
ncbi:MAG: OmpA family protein [Bacteroidales bacterium]|nr:OmpA family protein [Bacteroidales bacterium]